ncbi:MAG: hypothetical protein D3908_06235 [Candidatus Electrothrix sp. AUS4]|nr:hypothetical protein [Candidatus Electrothrix sp. AUS4]
MSDVLLNCWEVKKCGREPDGEKVPIYGVCPIATTTSLDGVNGGKNGGRCCWVFIPLLSNIITKSPGCSGGLLECRKCDFYQSIRKTTELLVRV